MHHGESTVFSVSEINALVREVLEDDFGEVAIEGETSNVRVHASGHVYFKLKDANAALNAVCFRSDARTLDFELSDGLRVVARGRLTVYEAQGTYQLVTRAIEPAGRGDLERAFRLLVAKLKEEGLFDEARKRPLPHLPRVVAVVTSPTGAAVRGERAPLEIVRALDALSERPEVDVVILARGGGSIEDLWAFNDEAVARAIHRCRAPVVSGVGHEADVTIADFVADRRAATPTMAAEIAVPDRTDLARRVEACLHRSGSRMHARLAIEMRRVAEAVRSYALGSVRGRVERAMQALDFAVERMALAAGGAARARQSSLATLEARLSGLSPREILRRGYTVCFDESGAHVLRAAEQAIEAGRIRIAFHDGTVGAVVEDAAAKPAVKEARP
jgi:exodeoxyribonuclease VII large subunit